jgi:hypothetical protein
MTEGPRLSRPRRARPSSRSCAAATTCARTASCRRPAAASAPGTWRPFWRRCADSLCAHSLCTQSVHTVWALALCTQSVHTVCAHCGSTEEHCAVAPGGAQASNGRTLALCCRSSTLHQIHEWIRCLRVRRDGAAAPCRCAGSRTAAPACARSRSSARTSTPTVRARPPGYGRALSVSRHQTSVCVALLCGRAGRATAPKRRLPARADDTSAAGQARGWAGSAAYAPANAGFSNVYKARDGEGSPGRVCHFKSDNPNPNALKDTYDYSCHYARLDSDFHF